MKKDCHKFITWGAILSDVSHKRKWDCMVIYLILEFFFLHCTFFFQTDQHPYKTKSLFSSNKLLLT